MGREELLIRGALSTLSHSAVRVDGLTVLLTGTGPSGDVCGLFPAQQRSGPPESREMTFTRRRSSLSVRPACWPEGHPEGRPEHGADPSDGLIVSGQLWAEPPGLH